MKIFTMMKKKKIKNLETKGFVARVENQESKDFDFCCLVMTVSFN